eukprot:14950514-Ditylum_brightwellii.AAC.1
MGAVFLQPGDDKDSITAMKDKDNGGTCCFNNKKSSLCLHTVPLESRHCKGNEKHLHSYLGEGYAIKYSIDKNRHILWACQFIAITD